MNVLSHRGLWTTPAERNTPAAFQRTLEAGFGTETDVRDFAGRLVVSHDPAAPDATPWADLVALFAGRGLKLAVNVKADGLMTMLSDALRDTDISWFAFDMSGPETVKYARAGLPFYTRHSDVEPEPILYEVAAGIWLDAFEQEWFGDVDIEKHLNNGKDVCVVSSELHGRDPRHLWDLLARMPHHESLSICTDRPEAAKRFFAS